MQNNNTIVVILIFYSESISSIDMTDLDIITFHKFLQKVSSEKQEILRPILASTAF